jgi:hypothetical protein
MRPLALAVFLAALAFCTATLSVMSPVRRRGGGTLATRLAKTKVKSDFTTSLRAAKTQRFGRRRS